MSHYPIKDFYTWTLFVQQYYRLLHRYAVLVFLSAAETDRIIALIMLSMWENRTKLHSEETISIFLKKKIRVQCSARLHREVLRCKTINIEKS